MQPVQQFRSDGAHLPPLQDRELRRLLAPDTASEEPDVDELVVGVDTELTAGPEALGRAPGTLSMDEGQAGGSNHPGFEQHRSTPVSVRNPQQKGTRHPWARRATIQRSGGLTGCTTERPYLDDVAGRHGIGRAERCANGFQKPSITFIRPAQLTAKAPYAYAAVTGPGQLVFTALQAAGAQLSDVVKTTIYVATSRQADLSLVWHVVRAAFGDHDAPSTLAGVSVLGYDDQLVEVEAMAICPQQNN